MEEFFTLPSGFLFGMVAPLHLEELDSFGPGDMVFLIQDLDRMLGVCQVSLEWCHVRKYNIHGHL
jgi:hypothetical protein